MKIMSTKNAGWMVMLFCAALLLAAPGCGTGAINTDAADSNVGDDSGTIDGTQITFDDPKTSSTSTCDSTQVIPNGMGSYFRYDNTIWDSSYLLARLMLHQVVLDTRTGEALYDLEGYGENGTLMALLARFDELAVANLGFGPISTIDCAVAGFSSKAGNFCSGDPGCPIGQMISGEISLMQLLQYIFQEFQRDGSLMMSLEDVGPTALADLNAFLEWGQLNHIFQTLFGGVASDVSVDPSIAVDGPDFAQSNPFQNLQFTMQEDGCILMSAGGAVFNADLVNLAAAAATPFLEICQVDKFLLVASPINMEDLVARATAVAGAGSAQNPMAESSCAIDTFPAVDSQPLGVAATQVKACVDFDKLNTTFMNNVSCWMGANPIEINQGGIDPCGGQNGIQSPYVMIARTLLYTFGRQPNMMRLGLGMTIDNPGMTSLALQFFQQGSAVIPVVERPILPGQIIAFDSSVGGSASTAGYYDLMFRIMSSHSDAMYEAFDPLKVQKMAVYTTDSGQQISLSLIAGVVDSLNNYLVQFQQYQAAH